MDDRAIKQMSVNLVLQAIAATAPRLVSMNNGLRAGALAVFKLGEMGGAPAGMCLGDSMDEPAVSDIQCVFWGSTVSAAQGSLGQAPSTSKPAFVHPTMPPSMTLTLS